MFDIFLSKEKRIQKYQEQLKHYERRYPGTSRNLDPYCMTCGSLMKVINSSHDYWGCTRYGIDHEVTFLDKINPRLYDTETGQKIV